MAPPRRSAAPSAARFLAELDEQRERAPARGRNPRRQRGQGRPVDADGARTRRNIMDAALRCFGRHGYDRTTNNQIADEADISSPTLYHYFDSKAALFQAVADEVAHALYGRIDELVAERSATLDRLAAVLEVLEQQIGENPDLAAFIATYAAEVRRNPDVLRLSPPALWDGPMGFFGGLATEGQRTGDLCEDISPEAVAGMMMSLIYGISLFSAVTPSPDASREVAAAFAAAMRGRLFGRPVAEGD